MPSLISIIKVYNSMQNYSASINLIDKELDIKIDDTFKKDSFIDLDKEFKEKIILKILILNIQIQIKLFLKI